MTNMSGLCENKFYYDNCLW